MEPKIDGILKSLGSADESDRCYALEDLQQIEFPAIVPFLITALGDRSARVRETAVGILIKLGGAAAAEGAAALLGTENIPLRNAAIEVLEKLGASALIALEKYVDDPSSDVKKFAIDTIGKLLAQDPRPHPAVLAALIEGLLDKDANVSGAAAEALGLAKDDIAIPFLLRQLVGLNRSSWLQCNIVVALARISSEESSQAIKQIDKTLLSAEAQVFLDSALKGEVL
jgi:HEAT repeat protein